uniref:Uncharacterized protein n=1 Tax=Anguilla anguilla TaxID=7936 RepID=A0A0E9U226_ANGAN
MLCLNNSSKNSQFLVCTYRVIETMGIHSPLQAPWTLAHYTYLLTITISFYKELMTDFPTSSKSIINYCAQLQWTYTQNRVTVL